MKLEGECKILSHTHTLEGFYPEKAKHFRILYYPKYVFSLEKEKILVR